MFKITPTSLLTSAGQVLLTLVLGFFMLLSLAVVGVKLLDYQESRSRVNKLHVVDTGRMHIYEGRDHSQSTFGVPVTCWKFVGKSQSDIRGASNYCFDDFQKNIPKWEEYRADNSSNFFMVVVVLLVIGLGIYFVVRMAAVTLAVVCGVTNEKVVSFMSTLIAVPFIFIGMITMSGMLQNTATSWTAPGEYPVQTHMVYKTSDSKFYYAAETMYDWTDTKVGTEVELP